MSRCRVCGGEARGAFCTFCGAPMGEIAPWPAQQDPADAPTQVAPPAQQPDPYAGYYRPAVQVAHRRSSGPPVLPVVAGILALAVVVVGALAVPRLLGSGTTTVPTVTSTTTVRSAPASSSTTATKPTISIPTATLAGDAEGAALTVLQTTASGHQGQLNAAVDAHLWVAQLSSKYVGINDPLQTTAAGSHAFNAVDILAEYRQLSGRIPDATVIVADSRTFGKKVSYNGLPFWRMLALSPAFSSNDAVVAWCARTFPELTGTALTNQCLPQQF